MKDIVDSSAYCGLKNFKVIESIAARSSSQDDINLKISEDLLCNKAGMNHSTVSVTADGEFTSLFANASFSNDENLRITLNSLPVGMIK